MIRELLLRADLDENGTQDLIVIEYQSSTMKQRMHMYSNIGNPEHSWVGDKDKKQPRKFLPSEPSYQ